MMPKIPKHILAVSVVLGILLILFFMNRHFSALSPDSSFPVTDTGIHTDTTDLSGSENPPRNDTLTIRGMTLVGEERMEIENDNTNTYNFPPSHAPYRTEINGYGQIFTVYESESPKQGPDGNMILYEREYDDYILRSEYDPKTGQGYTVYEGRSQIVQDEGIVGSVESIQGN